MLAAKGGAIYDAGAHPQPQQVAPTLDPANNATQHHHNNETNNHDNHHNRPPPCNQRQYRHYEATLAVLKLSPSEPSREFQELVAFVAQVRVCVCVCIAVVI